MECDGESQGGKLEAMPGTKGDGARGPSLIDRVEKKGDFVIFENGYTYYCPTSGGGGLTAHNLRVIADELDRRNAPVDELYKRSLENDR